MATCPTCNDTGVAQRPRNETFTRGGPPHYTAGTRPCPSCRGASAIDLTASNTTAPPDATPDDLPEAWKAGFNGA
jgi:hypothetical protein